MEEKKMDKKTELRMKLEAMRKRRPPKVDGAGDSASPVRGPDPASPSASPETRLSSAAREQSAEPAKEGGVLGKLGPSSAKVIEQVFPKRPTLTLVTAEQKPALAWSVAPQSKSDCYPKAVQTEPEFEPGSPGVGSPQATDRKNRQAQMLAPSSLFQGKTKGREEEEEEDDDKPEKPAVVSSGEQAKVMGSPRFSGFLNSAAFLVERALAQPDVLPREMANTQEAVLMRGAGAPLVRIQTFPTDSEQLKKLTKNCAVTSVDFAPTTPTEMLLASYRKRMDGGSSLLTDVEGQVLIWSSRVPHRPYKHLTAPEDVSKAAYCQCNPNLVVGGLYNGQVCLWDLRKDSSAPDLSPRTMQTHSDPVFGLHTAGVADSLTLVSLSREGRVCEWKLPSLDTPAESSKKEHMLDVGTSGQPRPIHATSLSFRSNDAARYFFGSEKGCLFESRCGGGNNPEPMRGTHGGPITAVDCHPGLPQEMNPSRGRDELADLVITSSTDWTCKLWNTAKQQPIFTFSDFADYVYDVKWSPVHPAVFATADGTGALCVWNLGESMEQPAAKVNVTQSSRQGAKPLTSIAWSQDGKCIVVGDASGDVSLWEVSGKEVEPKKADWAHFRQKVEAAA